MDKDDKREAKAEVKDKELIDFLEEVTTRDTYCGTMFMNNGYRIQIFKGLNNQMDYSSTNFREALRYAKAWWDLNKTEISPERFKKGN